MTTLTAVARGVGWTCVGIGAMQMLGGARAGDDSDLRTLAGLMGAGGASRLLTRATLGRPHRR